MTVAEWFVAAYSVIGIYCFIMCVKPRKYKDDNDRRIHEENVASGAPLMVGVLWPIIVFFFVSDWLSERRRRREE